MRLASMRPCGPPGRRAILALLPRMRCVSSTSKSAAATSGSRAISWKACPSVAGRMAAALANSMAASRSAELVMTLTWFDAGLADGGGHLAQAVHHLLFDLVDHSDIAEMHLADVDGAQLIAPLLRFVGDFGAHGLAHVVARLQHFRELHVAQAAHGGVAHVGAQRAARIGVLEQVGDRIADPHLVPDADAHGRAFLGVHRLAAQILLVEAHVEHVARCPAG